MTSAKIEHTPSMLLYNSTVVPAIPKSNNWKSKQNESILFWYSIVRYMATILTQKYWFSTITWRWRYFLTFAALQLSSLFPPDAWWQHQLSHPVLRLSGSDFNNSSSSSSEWSLSTQPHFDPHYQLSGLVSERALWLKFLSWDAPSSNIIDFFATWVFHS